MATRRSSQPKPLFEAQVGLPRCKRERLCRECGAPCVGRRRTWCSDTCVSCYRLRVDQGYAREVVLARDHGVCRTCTRDCRALERLRDQAILEAKAEYEAMFRASLARLLAASGDPDWQKFLALCGRKSWWEADHVVPFSQGGDLLGIDNLVTACVVCHRTKTRQEAQDRGLARKALRAKPHIKTSDFTCHTGGSTVMDCQARPHVPVSC
jgi:5-methylcytosine-specific restriction endonuclease McrA